MGVAPGERIASKSTSQSGSAQCTKSAMARACSGPRRMRLRPGEPLSASLRNTSCTPTTLPGSS